jgi:peroxiredoxin Q/BCP|tara:strand:- start:692 stop:1156 length:465 start_codon:yes stop_codon:yes gene_type:complete
MTKNTKAPNFKLESTSGKIIELNKIKSKYIVLYFYPKDDTPGCTLETKDFNKLLNKFKSLDSIILGISKDSIESHKKFKKKHNIKFDLLSDEEKKSIKAYKTWGKKKFMGREFMGQIRSSFVISKGKILNEWRNVRVKDHAQEILDFIKSFKKA